MSIMANIEDLQKIISEQKLTIATLQAEKQKLESKLEKANETQLEGLINLTKPQFKFLMTKAKINEVTIYYYLDSFDTSPIIAQEILKHLKIERKPIFITKDDYKKRMEEYNMPKNIITLNLKEYDEDPEFAQLWIPLSYQKNNCCIM